MKCECNENHDIHGIFLRCKVHRFTYIMQCCFFTGTFFEADVAHKTKIRFTGNYLFLIIPYDMHTVKTQ